MSEREQSLVIVFFIKHQGPRNVFNLHVTAIFVSHDIWSVGDKIFLQVRFFNVANETRPIELFNDDLRNVIIMVTGPDGKQPPWSPSFSGKRLGEMQASGFGGKFLCWKVDPSASLKMAFRLDEIYDLTTAGQYEVRSVHMLEAVMQATVLRLFYMEGWRSAKPRLESKPFRFTISPAKNHRAKTR